MASSRGANRNESELRLGAVEAATHLVRAFVLAGDIAGPIKPWTTVYSWPFLPAAANPASNVTPPLPPHRHINSAHSAQDSVRGTEPQACLVLTAERESHRA